MRHGRIIRRRKALVLNTLLFASALLFYETHAHLFMKEFATRQLEERLPHCERVTIGAIRGGVFRDLIAENVRVYPEHDDIPGFGIERIEIDYRLWYPILQRIPKVSSSRENRKITVSLGDKTRNGMHGFLELERDEALFSVSGYLGFGKETRFLVKGTIGDDDVSSFRITQKQGHIDLVAEQEKGTLNVRGRINHLKVHGTDLVGDCTATVRIKNPDYVEADITLKNLIIDYRPFMKDIEIATGYSKTKDTLNITRIKIGDEIEGYGYVRHTSPQYLYLNWTVTDLVLEEYFATDDIEESSSGLMNGQCTAKGPLKEVALSGHFDLQQGCLGDAIYDSVILNLKGIYPVILIYDSKMSREGGFISIGGEVDLSRLQEKDAFDALTYDPDKDFFVWEGWNVIKENGAREVKAEKFLGKDLRLRFRTYADEAKMETTEKKSDELDLEYKFDTNDSIQMTLGEEGDFIGVEHKVRF
jgi:hypothetical protein